jgi:hypothetical protein
MFEQAAGLAVLAAISPSALLVVAIYLASERPGRTTVALLGGAVAVSAIVGVIVLVAIRAGGLNLPTQHPPRYGLRLGLGVLALAAGLVLSRRTPRPAGRAKARRPRMT